MRHTKNKNTIAPKSIREHLKEDKKREERIMMEIIVDAYTPEEQAMGWYYYLEEKIQFPILATCREERETSPLEKGDEVEIISLAPEEECDHEMFVRIRWGRKGLAVPLTQLKPAGKVDNETRQAIEDWHYWLARGYEFGTQIL